MSTSIPIVAVIGRTNVGKSTLFNTLVSKRRSIVDDSSGVTRDRSYALVRREDFSFTLIDTAGLFAQEGELEPAVRAQTEIAIEESDLVIVMFDGIAGLHPDDESVVDLIRKAEKPVLWVVNKCEKPTTELTSAEFYSLGIEELIFISAAHRKGVEKLVELVKIATSHVKREPVKFEEDGPEAIRIAVLGKPNVGKSTLINKLLGEDRLVTSNIAGTTRDSVEVTLKHNTQPFVLVDTAGLRRKARINKVSVERYANLRSLGALAKSDVVFLLLDATEGLPSDQDLKLAELIHERGRGLIIVLNKWDAIEKDHRTAKNFKDNVQRAFRFAKYAPIMFISARTGRRCSSLLDKACQIYQSGGERVKTSDINKIFDKAFSSNPPPVFRGEPVKLYFATQIATQPPTFVLFVNHPRKIDQAYQRYLKNSLREEKAFEGYDVKIILRKRSERDNIRERAAGGEAR